MKKSVLFFYAILIGVLASSCMDAKKKDANSPNNALTANDFYQIEINNEYQLSIPKDMVPASNLNNQASLQYQNVEEELYTIVIDEPRDKVVSLLRSSKGGNSDRTLISLYTEMQMRMLSEAISIKNKSNPTGLKINGMDAEMVELEGTVGDIKDDIFYFLTLIEGKSKIYMVMSYTLSSKKETHKTTFEQIAKSFKTIK